MAVRTFTLITERRVSHKVLSKTVLAVRRETKSSLAKDSISKKPGAESIVTSGPVWALRSSSMGLFEQSLRP